MTDDVTLLKSVPVGHAEGRRRVKKSWYGERDYAFGQLVLGLRTSIGLTQAGLARHLSISRQAGVGREDGSKYTKGPPPKTVIALAVHKAVLPLPPREHEAPGARKAAPPKVRPH